MSARGLGTLLQAVKDHNIIVPTKDVPIGKYDRITCRIIKFGKQNSVHWQAKEDREANDTDNLRIYLHCYKFLSAKAGKELEEHRDKGITINPNVKWLSEIVATQQSLEEKTGDPEALFKQKVELFRKDRTGSRGDYGYIEVTDLGTDASFRNDDAENMIDVDDNDEMPRPLSENTKDAIPAGANKREKLRNDLNACETVEEAHAMVKPLLIASSGDERQQIADIYKQIKDHIVMRNVGKSDNVMAAATAAAERYYKTDTTKQAELLQWAKLMTRTEFPPPEEAEDDIPM